MSRVSELIDLIVQGKNAEASEVLNSELLSRSYEAINDFRPHVAADYFQSVVGEPQEGEVEEEELDDDTEPTYETEEEVTDEAD